MSLRRELPYIVVNPTLIKGVYWIRTFNNFHRITKSIKIMLYWIRTFKDSIKVMVYLIKNFKDFKKFYKSHDVFD